MVHRIRNICSATIATVLLLSISPAQARTTTPDDNRGLDTVHAPVVSRTDFVFDAVSSPSGLARGERDRLTGWFDGFGLGYGDTITLDTSGVFRNSASVDAVAAIVADYGMLVSHDAAPITAGHPASGSIRVIVSRSVAAVPGCPDWSVGNTPTHNSATPSNFGCATVANLAAMVANPQDLIEGRNASHASADLSVKAIKSYRDAKNTGDGGLPGGITHDSVIKSTGGN